jgi:hypothetical protein
MTSKTTQTTTEKECDLCDSKAGYDCKTKMGSWAYLCETHFKSLGVGLGTGKGQKLKPTS